jgi:hypothetical protein
VPARLSVARAAPNEECGDAGVAIFRVHLPVVISAPQDSLIELKVVNLECRLCRISTGRADNCNRLKWQPVGSVVFTDLHKSPAALAPFRWGRVVYLVVAVSLSCPVSVGRIDMPVRSSVGRNISICALRRPV